MKYLDKEYFPVSEAQLFKKAAVFTDIHFGRRQNSRVHNLDCEMFVKWFCEEAVRNGCETAIMMGDWHDHRRTINVSTLNYTLTSLELLHATFKQVFITPGNHDLFYREKREINSIEFGRNLNRVHIIRDPIVLNGVALIPWLTEEDFETVRNLDAKYVFGHLELPQFLMNARVEMPDHGGMNAGDFTKPDYVFSGHFHKRQNQKNIWYIGNAFPMDFNDAWDDDRGMMIFEWGGTPEFQAWPDQPRYRNLALSTLLENPLVYLDKGLNLKVTADVDLSFEELTAIRESFSNNFGLREIQITSAARNDDEWEFSHDDEFQSIDQIVLEGLKTIDTRGGIGLDASTLIAIYESL